MFIHNYKKKNSDTILSFHYYLKIAIAVISDLAICGICTWLAFYLRLEELILFRDLNLQPILISIFIALPIFWLFGLYRIIFSYNNLSTISSIFSSILIYGLLYFCVIGIYGLNGVPRSIGIIQPMLLFFGVVITRFGVKYLFINYDIENKNDNKKNVLIYGAGDAGMQLVKVLKNNFEHEVVGFLDDDINLQSRNLLGKTIYSISKLDSLIHSKGIDLIFLAMPGISKNKRNEIIDDLSKYKLSVKTLPGISEIINGKITSSDIKELNVDELLNRKEVQLNEKLIKKNITSKTVLVTGAGGSIGSELCRQIIKLKSNKLLLLEINEFALHKIYEELISLNENLKIIPLLVNVQDQTKLEMILENFRVDTVYHTAAYKHVPLVEENICEGVKNNVFSTLAIARASVIKKVSSLVLISSDKAVRPTNVMGASKRLSELCMQGIYNQNKDTSTNFSIVRFGNVLESSGSAVTRFKQQIREGGPVTLTDKDVTRYFMTLNEAAQLVIQAGAMGKKSEVFLLDMGKSIKIIDLIHRMIKLSGLSVKDEINPNGDIPIKIIGLRPGEKLYEELLIQDEFKKTDHSKIVKTLEPYIQFDQLESDLSILKGLLDNNDVVKVKDLLYKVLEIYKPETRIVDHIYNEQLLSNVVKVKFD